MLHFYFVHDVGARAHITLEDERQGRYRLCVLSEKGKELTRNVLADLRALENALRRLKEAGYQPVSPKQFNR